MVQVLVNLLAVPVLLQEAAEHSQAAHPQDLGGQTSLTGTTTLTWGRDTFAGDGQPSAT